MSRSESWELHQKFTAKVMPVFTTGCRGVGGWWWQTAGVIGRYGTLVTVMVVVVVAVVVVLVV